MGLICSAIHNRFGRGGVCTSKAQIKEKTVIITGCNTGIGKETAVDLAKRGGRIIMACRSQERALPALEEVQQRSGSSNIKFMQLDLASLQSVRKFANQFLGEEERLDILINNAGVMMCPQMKTEDGFEMQMGTNHLGHFLLTNLLLDKLKQSGPGSRIVNVSSRAHHEGQGIQLDNLMMENNYSSRTQYGHSKLANILFTKELAKRIGGSGVTTYALHPGVILTELWRFLPNWVQFLLGTNFFQMFTKTPAEGSQTTIHCAISEEVKDDNGIYYADCKPMVPLLPAESTKLASQLWDLSENLVGLSNSKES